MWIFHRLDPKHGSSPGVNIGGTLRRRVCGWYGYLDPPLVWNQDISFPEGFRREHLTLNEEVLQSGGERSRLGRGITSRLLLYGRVRLDRRVKSSWSRFTSAPRGTGFQQLLKFSRCRPVIWFVLREDLCHGTRRCV